MAKFIGVKMIEATPMRASMALSAGYKIGNAHPDGVLASYSAIRFKPFITFTAQDSCAGNPKRKFTPMAGRL